MTPPVAVCPDGGELHPMTKLSTMVLNRFTTYLKSIKCFFNIPLIVLKDIIRPPCHQALILVKTIRLCSFVINLNRITVRI